MHNVHKIANPDLKMYPLHRDTLKENEWGTIGDLHGNPIKLLYIMIVLGAVTVSEEDYKAYCNNPSTLPPSLKVTKGARIRLIGDDFCDRWTEGHGDIHMMELQEKFVSEGGELETIFSNHTAEFITAIEHAINHSLNEKGQVVTETFRKIFTTFTVDMREDQKCSFVNLQKYFFTASQDVIQRFLRQYYEYKNRLKVFSYDYNADGSATLYSHGRLSKRMMVLVAQQMSPRFTTEECSNVESINDKLTAYEAEQHKAPQDRTAPKVTEKDMLPLIDAVNRVFQVCAGQDEISSSLLGNGLSCLQFAIERRAMDDPDINLTHGHDYGHYGNSYSLDTCIGRSDCEMNEEELQQVLANTPSPTLKEYLSNYVHDKTFPYTKTLAEAPVCSPKQENSALPVREQIAKGVTKIVLNAPSSPFKKRGLEGSDSNQQNNSSRPNALRIGNSPTSAVAITSCQGKKVFIFQAKSEPSTATNKVTNIKK